MRIYPGRDAVVFRQASTPIVSGGGGGGSPTGTAKRLVGARYVVGGTAQVFPWSANARGVSTSGGFVSVSVQPNEIIVQGLLSPHLVTQGFSVGANVAAGRPIRPSKKRIQYVNKDGRVFEGTKDEVEAEMNRQARVIRAAKAEKAKAPAPVVVQPIKVSKAVVKAIFEDDDEDALALLLL